MACLSHRTTYAPVQGKTHFLTICALPAFLLAGGSNRRTAATHARHMLLLATRIADPAFAPARQTRMSASTAETGERGAWLSSDSVFTAFTAALRSLDFGIELTPATGGCSVRTPCSANSDAWAISNAFANVSFDSASRRL